ncbi:hypothetical protein [Streptacidiphilus sp. PAMC 29251]
MLRGLGNFRPLTAVGALAFSGVAVLLVARHAPAPREFTVHPVDLRSTVALTGYLEPAVTWRLYFGAATAGTGSVGTTPGGACNGAAAPGAGLGTVTTLRVGPGDRVSRGQVLAEAGTEQAAAQLKAAQADLDQATAQLAQDRAQPTAAASATATAAAEGSTPAGPAPQPAIGPDLDRIQHDQDRLAELQRTLDSARITAPADGIVQEVDTATGATPDCHDPAIVLRSTALRAHVQAPSAVLGQLRAEEPAQLALAGTSLRLDSAVSVLPQAATVLPQAATALPPAPPVLVPVAAASAGSAGPQPMASQNYSLDLALPVPPPAALPGMAVTATVTVDQRLAVLAVPAAAVRHERSGIHVTVLHCPPPRRAAATAPR